MTVYVVITPDSSTALSAKIADVYPNDHYRINDSQWLISADKLPHLIAADLDAAVGEFGQIGIFGVSGYYGWHSRTIWDWLKLKESK